MKRRVVTIALAVVLAALGTGGVLAYVSHANSRALAGQRAVTVLVAHGLIPEGTTAANAQTEGLLSAQQMPASSVPADALAQITPDISGLVTDADVQPGQLLLRPMLVTATQASTGLAVPPGMFAVAIQFCVPEAVAGNVQPGSQVAVFDTTLPHGSGAGSGSGSGNSSSSGSSMNGAAACSGSHQYQAAENDSTTLVLPRVTVLAVGQGTGGAQNTSTTNASSNIDLVTVAVSQADAEKLIQISENGLPYLALLAAT